MSEPTPEPIQSAPPGKAGTRPPTSKNTASLKKFRILMLHGYTQSGPSFATKTSALKKVLNTALKPHGLESVLIYPTAPNKLSPLELPSPDEEDKPDPEWYAWVPQGRPHGRVPASRQGHEPHRPTHCERRGGRRVLRYRDRREEGRTVCVQKGLLHGGVGIFRQPDGQDTIHDVQV
ncbi:predicted protein [Chaetomium globosum CBS 148.51]|uniref:Serine hydrolase domain-containing protein n=1 Tax=Chaetomium globosum (strain ATCC 6205 / CBS 148.51 / DSM 1962 / NBRC 6347 / NRRL 1970) TaxID=306901 RepID=Q2H3L0_CHAGB|nr:uncharacterized protein CHGG_06755 [Chaetomium globosum CBS 148.51]EAQ90136.1 predicted protein [Chaetomium globosum CBS 148.51]